jgi:hypothetical protein
MSGFRRVLILGAALCAAVVLLAPAAQGAGAKKPKVHHCKSSDLRYRFKPGLPKDFGVFRLTITRGKCSTARSVARTWKRRFETALTSGAVKLPKHVNGFTFRTLKATAAQTYREQGRKGPKRRKTTIRFDYVVPNG